MNVSLVIWISPIIAFVLCYLFMYYHFGRKVYCTSKNLIRDKIVLITGGSNGIGKEVAVDLARRRGIIIIASRSFEKGNDAVRYIQQCSQNQNIFWRQLNLSDLSSIRDFCQKFMSDFGKLDILINNAALAYEDCEKTIDGYDLAFGTNHLGHFLLTELLLPHIKLAAPSRIVNVSSLAHILVGGPLEFDTIPGENNLYPNLTGYEVSKLANILHAKELARRVAQYGIIANAVHPGAVDTELWSKMVYKWPKWFCFLLRLFLKPIFINTQDAAQTIIYVAISDDVANITGRYFSHCALARESIQAKSVVSAEKLWQVSCYLTGLQPNTIPLEISKKSDLVENSENEELVLTRE